MTLAVIIPAAWLGLILATVGFCTLAARAHRRREETEKWLRDCTLLEVDGRCDVCGMASEASMCDRCWAEADRAYERLMDRGAP